MQSCMIIHHVILYHRCFPKALQLMHSWPQPLLNLQQSALSPCLQQYHPLHVVSIDMDGHRFFLAPNTRQNHQHSCPPMNYKSFQLHARCYFKNLPSMLLMLTLQVIDGQFYSQEKLCTIPSASINKEKSSSVNKFYRFC
mgnify:CR=1 FL=1